MSSFPPVLPGPRRIVTTHNEEGKAIASVDVVAPSFVRFHSSSVVLIAIEVPGMDGIRSGSYWATIDGLPTNDNNSTEDGAARTVGEYGLVAPGVTNFRYTDLAPGTTTPMHRTPSIDYNILVSGELILINEAGEEKHLKNPGDAVIQKGTNHAWKNPSATQWTRWATVLVDGTPAIVGGKELGFYMG
ncbi:hypothetical protein BJ138DRAFT_1082079 [Hygrophoropsis aurantiaca]|uniref:Uncharacterized protein n=1 Tax=Hygrophoropsis aurantiaca TaxID=72124 RepID=A0ACB8AJZ2_9AGAM|nr:hypothetical protein BJ138DRAFT_1082079 [Hygrophoropsis aurantiaca]